MSSWFGRLVVGGITGALMLFGYQYAMNRAIQRVIASQPPAQQLAPAPSFDFGDCDLGLNLYQSGSRKPPCELNSQPLPEPEPIVTMSKKDSEEIGLWFVLATLALPLSLAGFALTGYWVIRAKFSSSDTEF